MRLLELLFAVALVLYTFVIWRHRLKHEFRSWMVWLFGIGLAADISGTVFLCIAAADSWKFSLHTISGFVSLVIMALHFSWAVLAKTIHGRFENYFNRFSFRAWLIWLVAFFSGLPLY